MNNIVNAKLENHEKNKLTEESLRLEGNFAKEEISDLQNRILNLEGINVSTYDVREK
jgi:hypothetical protein